MTALANRVRETTITIGAGDLTLLGAIANHRTFNTAFGVIPRFYYVIEDEANAVWEGGIGYLSAASTLVRETVMDNSSENQTALVLSAGTKSVFCAPLMQSMLVGSYYSTYDAEVSAHLYDARTTFAMVANRLTYAPYQVRVGRPYANMTVEVTTAAASGTLARLGLYTVGADGYPSAKIVETATFLVDTTGMKTVAAALPYSVNGDYWICMITDGSPTIRGTVNNGHINNKFRGTADYAAANAYRFTGGSGNALPDSAPSTSNGSGVGPIFGLSV